MQSVMSGSLALLRMTTLCVITFAAFTLISCGSTEPVSTDECTGYSDWQSSAYVLPYPPGLTYSVIQGNCSPAGDGHTGATRYAYDFATPIGSQVVAIRAGTVLDVEQSHFDGQVGATGFDNYVVIGHTDGTTALYGHLTNEGSYVAVGESVAQGALVGFSGNTGNTNNIPHLHVSVQTCDPVTKGTTNCPTIPVTFRNTDANPEGLIRGRAYTAR